MSHTKHILDYARARTERIIQDRFTSSFMSDPKWVRLMHALTSIGASIREFYVKLVWDDVIRKFWANEETKYRFDYYDHAVEALISGYPRGWFSYKEIEWIRFDACLHDLDLITNTLKTVGEFFIERTDDSLTLYGYR